jgi:hypothetical protein
MRPSQHLRSPTIPVRVWKACLDREAMATRQAAIFFNGPKAISSPGTIVKRKKAARRRLFQ